MPSHSKEIKLANPRGFCAGVDRAIDIVNKALEIYGSPVYVKHEVVHNKHVVEDLKNRGAVFVEEIDEIPDNSLVIFSAHGVSDQVEELIEECEDSYNFQTGISAGGHGVCMHYFNFLVVLRWEVLAPVAARQPPQ